jgi:serine/threonine protein kinase
LAIDHEDNQRRVALKFMKRKSQFEREIGSRSEGFFDEAYVVNIIRVYGAMNDDYDDGDMELRNERARKGLSSYPYCIVMQAGDRSLADILSKEHLKRDWDRIRSISLSIARCVAHVHSKGFIHGDLKRK